MMNIFIKLNIKLNIHDNVQFTSKKKNYPNTTI